MIKLNACSIERAQRFSTAHVSRRVSRCFQRNRQRGVEWCTGNSFGAAEALRGALVIFSCESVRNCQMPTRTHACRILIASPSDLQEEREAAARAIAEWNDLHAAQEQVVLLPQITGDAAPLRSSRESNQILRGWCCWSASACAATNDPGSGLIPQSTIAQQDRFPQSDPKEKLGLRIRRCIGGPL